METSLHQQLKEHYAASPDQIEVKLGRFRIDVVRGEELLEIQCASISAIRKKIQRLLEQSHQVRVIKPVIARTRICYVNARDGDISSRRWSPKRGQLHDLFEELIYLRGIFPHPNLVLEFPVVEVEQHRIKSKRKKRRWRDRGYQSADTKLTSVLQSVEVAQPDELWNLLPPIRWATPRVKKNRMPIEFNTEDLATHADCPRWIAQRIAYVLKHSDAIEQVGRNKHGIRYRRLAVTRQRQAA